MAGKARNSMMVQARRKTEELAAKRREREAALQSLATDYHAATMMAEAMVEEAERQAAELIAAAKKNAGDALEDAKETVRKMLATGETRQGIAELLDVSVSYVRSIDVATPKKAKAGVDGGEAESARSEESGGVGVLSGHERSDH
jgi:dsDNA-specific endonuclease/ATPase MutS2